MMIGREKLPDVTSLPSDPAKVVETTWLASLLGFPGPIPDVIGLFAPAGNLRAPASPIEKDVVGDPRDATEGAARGMSGPWGRPGAPWARGGPEATLMTVGEGSADRAGQGR